jgi:hypothetical protein
MEAEMSAAATARLPSVVRDFDIQVWVHEKYGFVPHPFWIGHCKELYLGGDEGPTQARKAWHECPIDKRDMIKAAFVHLGLLQG